MILFVQIARAEIHVSLYRNASLSVITRRVPMKNRRCCRILTILEYSIIPAALIGSIWGLDAATYAATGVAIVCVALNLISYF